MSATWGPVGEAALPLVDTRSSSRSLLSTSGFGLPLPTSDLKESKKYFKIHFSVWISHTKAERESGGIPQWHITVCFRKTKKRSFLKVKNLHEGSWGCTTTVQGCKTLICLLHSSHLHNYISIYSGLYQKNSLSVNSFGDCNVHRCKTFRNRRYSNRNL